MIMSAEDPVSEMLARFKNSSPYKKLKGKALLLTADSELDAVNEVVELGINVAAIEFRKDKKNTIFITAKGKNGSAELLLSQNGLGELFFAGKINCPLRLVE